MLLTRIFHMPKDFALSSVPLQSHTTKSRTARTRVRVTMFSRLTAALALAMLASACTTSTPLPAWNPVTADAPSATSSTTQPPSANQPATVRTTPIAPTVPLVAVQPFVAPYGAAVAARFPEPAVRYSTPGMVPGRSTEQQASSPQESADWLRDQAAAARQIPGVKAEVLEFGTSRQGQPLLALALARAAGGIDPATLKANALPTLLLMSLQPGTGGLQARPGTEALLALARELSQGLLVPLLSRANVLIVPYANPDAPGSDADVALDASLDALLLNMPESQALARLVHDYQPMVIADVRDYAFSSRTVQTLGGLQKFDALIQHATTANQPEFLTRAAQEWFRQPLIAALKGQGLSTEWLHAVTAVSSSPNNTNSPGNSTTSDMANAPNVAMGSVQPGNARNVGGLKNAVSLVIESRGGPELGLMHLQRRVHTHVTALGSVLASAAQRASELNQLRAYIDKEAASFACQGTAVVLAKPTPAQYELLVLDAATGADKAVVVQWNSALALQTVKTRARPCGYWLSARSSQTVERLEMHGIQVLRLTESGSVMGDAYQQVARLPNAAPTSSVLNTAPVSDAPFNVSLQRSLIDMPRGSYWVPLNQPLAHLAMAALEPDTPTSFFSNRLIQSLEDVARIVSEPTMNLQPVQ